ncbi:phosphoglycerate dehydrogenase, partial [bacterium]|nr:phosphoglycerate dehydrogenase [bacterium]
MLAASRNIPQGYLSLKEGKWDRKKFVGYELQEKCLGIIGLGRIGRQVATRAQAFGMKTIGYDPLISPEVCARLKIELVELNELFRLSDYITVHTPLSPETRHIIAEKEIEMMKQGVVIINCARGGIIDEEALHKGLVSGKVRASALDVFEKEPPFGSPLLSDENCIFVPHLGASTKEAQKSVGIEIANQMKEALTTGVMRNTVNIPYIDPQMMKALSPFIKLSDSLGKLSAQLIDGKITSIGIEYSGELVGRDLSLLSTTIVRSILSFFLPDETVNYVNALSFAKDMGIEISFSEKQARLNYTSLISVTVAGKEKRTVSGTVFSETNPRIVQIDNFSLELIGEGNLLILSQTDQPGIIGKIGTLLGSRGINIASLQLARTKKGGDSLSVWSIDEAVSDAILKEIRQMQEISSAKAVVL